MEFRGFFHADQPTDYFGADMETVWLTVTEKIPEMKPLIQKMMEKS